MRIRTNVKSLLLPLLLLAVTGSLAIACSVPVFRYALEHWRPDAYVVYVFQNGDVTGGELNAEQHKIVDSLQPFSGQTANIKVQIVDINSNRDAEISAIWEANKSETLPWIVLQSPPKWGVPQTIWQGEVTSKNVAGIVTSPIRNKIHKRLVDGESVVWVLLESGKAEEDNTAFLTLTTELEKAQGTIKLPEIETEDLGDLSVDPNALKVAFSAVRISRDDPDEQVLVEMLQRVEPDLMEEQFRSQPMAFPVFGRGRALYALVGKGISADLITEASQFLCGACQCTVKAQNPGVDLIMNVDWDEVIEPIEVLDEGLPPLAGFSGFGASDDESPDNTDEVATNATDESSDPSADDPSADNSIADASQAEDEETQVASADMASDSGVGSSSGKTGGAGTTRTDFRLMMIIGVALGIMLVGVVVATMVILPRKDLPGKE
jgi:hypothetical protein